jgi:hypothetical protein
MSGKLIYALALTGLAAVISLAGCTGTASTIQIPPTPLLTSESRSSDGFEYDVTVSNIYPMLGETVTITVELKNISNTAVPANDIFGETTIEIKNSSGDVVWGFFTSRTASTLTVPISTGYTSSINATWTATSMPGYVIQVAPDPRHAVPFFGDAHTDYGI